jgi:lambda family phage portal protein
MTIEFAPADADLVGAPEGQQLSADAAGPLVRNEGQFASAAFAAASASSQELGTYFPALHSADSAILPERAITVARTHDLVRNDPTAATAVNRLVDMLVGASIRMAARPDPDALGFDRKDKAQRDVVRQLARQLDKEFRLFLKDPLKRCDAQRKLTGQGLFRLAARTFSTLNETCATMMWRPERGARYATCVLMVDPERLSNPYNAPDLGLMRGGIEFSDIGEPLAYHVRQAHPGDWYAPQKTMTWERIPKATAWGRPVFIHGFEAEREGQSRAISPFACLVPLLRMIARYAQLELNNAALNALMGAFLTSNLPPDAAASQLSPGSSSIADKRISHYTKFPPTMAGVRIPVLQVGDEIKMNASPRPTTAFPLFLTAFLQRVAAARGISYEQLAMDWSKTNYSSARAALNEVFRTISRLFAQFSEQFLDPIRYCHVEEAFDRGYLAPPDGAPDFWELPAAYLNGRWIGPGRGYVDPTKEAEGANMRIDGLLSTLQDEAATQGLDFEELLDQAEFEQEELTTRKLVRKSTAPTAKGSDAEIINDAGQAGPGAEPAAGAPA